MFSQSFRRSSAYIGEVLIYEKTERRLANSFDRQVDLHVDSRHGPTCASGAAWTREMYVPLSPILPPGDAQCDFGQAKAVIEGVEQTIHYFVLDLPHSDACLRQLP